MGAAERRLEIMKILCRRRHETIGRLAEEFGVSTRTIQRDIDILSITEPLFTQQGKYNGGVYVVEGYSIDRMYMRESEIEVLKKLLKAAEVNIGLLTAEERIVLTELISQYTKPTT